MRCLGAGAAHSLLVQVQLPARGAGAALIDFVALEASYDPVILGRVPCALGLINTQAVLHCVSGLFGARIGRDLHKRGADFLVRARTGAAAASFPF